MKKYRVIFGGQQHYEAASEEDAYTQFYEWVQEMMDDRNFGLVIEEVEE